MSTATIDGHGHLPELIRVMGPKLLLLFIVGDILGTGVYALTGQVASEVGGAAWAPFLLAFAVATVTAFSYLELVTRYPQAAGAEDVADDEEKEELRPHHPDEAGVLAVPNGCVGHIFPSVPIVLRR